MKTIPAIFATVAIVTIAGCASTGAAAYYRPEDRAHSGRGN